MSDRDRQYLLVEFYETVARTIAPSTASHDRKQVDIIVSSRSSYMEASKYAQDNNLGEVVEQEDATLKIGYFVRKARFFTQDGKKGFKPGHSIELEASVLQKNE